MERICPKCSYKLQNSDNYFCSSCGITLPDELVKLPNNIRVKKYVPLDKLTENKPNTKVKKKTINKNLILVVFLLLIIGLSVFFILKSGIVKLILNQTKLETQVSKIIGNNDKKNNRLSLNLSITSSNFNKREYINHIPADIAFYFEGTNLTDLMDLDLFEPDNEELRKITKLVMEPEFAGFMSNSDQTLWGFLFTPKDVQIAQDLLAEKLGSYWQMAVINSYIVIANDPSVFEKVKSVDDNLVPSLSKSPEFLTAKKNLDASGQFQICYLKDNSKDLIRRSMSGFNAPTIGMISEILNSNEKCLVVTNSL